MPEPLTTAADATASSDATADETATATEDATAAAGDACECVGAPDAWECQAQGVACCWANAANDCCDTCCGELMAQMTGAPAT